MEKGRILLLNGPSSAGKTTLSWELQTKAPGFWYWLALDYFFDAVPSQLWERDEGKGFRNAFDLHHDCVRLLSDQGKDVIMDTVLCSRESISSFAQKLADCPVTMVKVICPVEELNRRELARGDRDIGLAAGQAEIIARQNNYDLTVDTHGDSTEECARQIIGLLTSGRPSAAFQSLLANPNQWANEA